MLNPTALLDQAQLRHKELVEQAEKERLVRQLMANRPGLARQMMAWFKARTKPPAARSTGPIPVYGKR